MKAVGIVMWSLFGAKRALNGLTTFAAGKGGLSMRWALSMGPMATSQFEMVVKVK